MTTVAVYGSVNWDEICQLPRYPGPHEKLDALAIDSALGGSAANTATWLAARSDRVELIGAVGDDPEGALCLDWLRRAGVGVGAVQIVTGERTSRACSWVVGTDKRIVTHRTRRVEREYAPPPAIEVARSAAHLHLGSLIDGAAYECLDAAQAMGASISIELSGRTHDVARACADIVFLNTQELRSHFSVEIEHLDAEAVASVAPRPGATLVVTDGASAVHCGTAEGIRSFPVEPLEQVVDRTGAGDAFDAGFIAAWLASDNELDAAVAGGLAASRQALQQVGGARRPNGSV
jgi:ribokinase